VPYGTCGSGEGRSSLSFFTALVAAVRRDRRCFQFISAEVSYRLKSIRNNIAYNLSTFIAWSLCFLFCCGYTDCQSEALLCLLLRFLRLGNKLGYPG
jgi:hypothetical protein